MTSSITNLVESARLAKSPIVGIPIPGEKPFCLRRSLLVDSLKGLKIIDAAIQLPLPTSDNRKPEPQLVVYASGQNVQAIRKFNPLPHHVWLKLELSTWAAKEREKRSKPVAPKLTARGKQIIRLEKQLSKLRVHRPDVLSHPMLDRGLLEVESRRRHDLRESDACTKINQESDSHHTVRTLGQQYADYKREAPLRQSIFQLGQQCRSGKLTTTQLYRLLSDRNIHCRKWSDLNTHDKERCGDLFGYLSKLWEFCGLFSKPSYWFDPPSDYVSYGATRYQHWLEQLSAQHELESMISTLRDLDAAQTDRTQK